MPLNRIDSPFDKIQYDIDCNSVVAVKSPIMFSYESNVLSLSGSRASASIKVVNAASITDGYILNFNQQIITFSSNPNVFQAKAFPATAIEILNSLAYVLSTNPALSFNYSFFVVNDTIEIKALFDTSLLDITLSQSAILPSVANGLALASTGAVNANYAQSKTNYAVEIEVWVDETNKELFLNSTGVPYTSSNFIKLTNLAKSFSKDNFFEFDISTALKPFVRNKPPKYFKFPTWERAFEMFARYAIVVYETYTENGQKVRNPIEKLGFNLPTDRLPNALYFVNSEMYKPYTFNENYQEFYEYWRRKPVSPNTYNKVRCLNHLPTAKRTQINAREYLYFIFDKTVGYDTFQLRVDFTFENCDIATKIIGSPERNDFNGQEGGIYYIEVSPQIFDIPTLEADAGSMISSYKVLLQEVSLLDNQFINETQTYILDNDSRCFDNEGLNIIFANPLGGYDTLTPLGNCVKVLESKKLSHQKTLQHKTLTDKFNQPYTDYSKIAEFVDYDSTNIISYEINSGWVDEDHYNWLKDLVKSNEIYLIFFNDDDLRAEPRRCSLSKAKWERNSLDETYNLSFILTLGYEV